MVPPLPAEKVEKLWEGGVGDPAHAALCQRPPPAAGRARRSRVASLEAIAPKAGGRVAGAAVSGEAR